MINRLLSVYPRIGINKLTEFLTPLYEKNLKCVLLFGSIQSKLKVGEFFS